MVCWDNPLVESDLGRSNSDSRGGSTVVMLDWRLLGEYKGREYGASRVIIGIIVPFFSA